MVFFKRPGTGLAWMFNEGMKLGGTVILAISNSLSAKTFDFSRTTLKRLRYSPLYSNAFYLILNKAAGSVLGFVFWALMARTFVPATVGIASALMAASGLISTLANLSLGTGMVRFAPEVKEKWKLAGSVYTVTVITATAASVIYLAGVREWSPALRALCMTPLLAGGFVLTSIFSTLSGVMDSSFIAQRISKLVFTKNMVGSLVRIPLPFLIFVGLGGYGIFFSFGTATFLAVATALVWFVPAAYPGFRPAPRLDKQLLGKVIPFSVSNYVANFFINAIGFIFPIMVLNLLGRANVAYFTIAWLIAGVIGTIPNSLSTSLFADASHNPQNLGRQLKRSLWLTMLLLAAGITVTQLVSGWLLVVFHHSYAVHGKTVLFWLMVENFPGAINAFYITVNQVRKKVGLIILQSGITSILTLTSAYVLMARLGLAGVGAGYALSNLAVAVVVAVPLWRVMRENRPAAA